MYLLSCFLCLTIALSQIPSINKFTKKMEKKSGYFDYYIDEDNNKIFLAIKKYNEEFLYVNSLSAGLGSNDIGLDRGQMGSEHLVQFEKYGKKVLLKQKNSSFRANSKHTAERKAVEEAFAQSVLFATKIVARSKNTDLIDISDFIYRDSHDVVRKLKRMNEGHFTLMKNASVIYKAHCKNFPKNTELEVQLTFKGEAKGRYIRSVLINNSTFTLRTHHSFLELPDNNYKPRNFDPRSGSYSIRFFDYATAIDKSLSVQYIVRHRLEKKDPKAKLSEVKKPIVYYLDPGTPEPIRSALLDGAKWWNEAFEAAGFKNAYQVKILPEDVDPMDVRYNVIQWVHRSTRGWSYGTTVVDPRTGEIIKGHVNLGSLRVRQDFMIAEALLSPYGDGSHDKSTMEKMALARLRQLSAHEIGHTLGLAHNFASSVNGRLSVMDYPHPYIELNNGKLDFSKAYGVGIGDWDKAAIKYAYGEYSESELRQILIKNQEKGYHFISDADARPKSGLHPYAHLWDNGSDPVQELKRIMDLRMHSLKRFGKNALKNGERYSNLESKLVPLYFYHRYQVEAVVKLLGGMEYHYAIKGDGDYKNKIVNSELQRNAVAVLLSVLSEENLKVPGSILDIIPPKSFGSYRDREQFKLRTTFNLDQLSLIEANTSFIFSLIFNSSRLNRLVDFRIRDKSLPSLNWLLEESFKKVNSIRNPAIKITVHSTLVNQLYKALKSGNANSVVRSILFSELKKMYEILDEKIDDTDDSYLKSYYIFLKNDIELFIEKPLEYKIENMLKMPPGSPIGMGCDIY